MTLWYDSVVEPNEMTYDDVEKMAGVRMAEFCKNYGTFYRTLTSTTMDIFSRRGKISVTYRVLMDSTTNNFR